MKAPRLLFLLTASAWGQQSAMAPAGPQAQHIANLWWFFFWLLGAIFIIVMGAAAFALMRRPPEFDWDFLRRIHQPTAGTESRLVRGVAAASITTLVILFVLMIASVSTGKAISGLATRPQSLAVEVVGNQWWWYVRYLNDDASQVVVTANEIHIPVGRPVMIRGTSHDVIHSFWVPNLNGKVDLIPSRITTEWIEADRPGQFRGQCAEFCGLQHAHMALWVVAEPPDQFQAWMNRQLQPAREPTDAGQMRGRQVFLDSNCVLCHSIRGTTAGGQNAPDLTHFGSRLALAAGTLPNTRGNLGGWILDPQRVKPGNHMATPNLNPADVDPLLDYLGSLQ